MNFDATLKLSQDSIALSDTITATVSIDGAAPLAVTPPTPLLMEASNLSWKIQPAGPSTVSKLLDGQERWTQVYSLEPFTPGDSVPVEFAAFSVSTGADAAVAVNLPKITVAVRLTIGDASAQPRPVTGPEPLPPEPVRDSTNAMPFVAVAVAAIVLILAMIFRRKPVVPPPDAQTQVQTELTLAEAEPDPKRFAERVSNALRGYFENRNGQPVTKQTTPEIAAHNSTLADILTQCDAVKFAGESAIDRAALLASARQLVAPPTA